MRGFSIFLLAPLVGASVLNPRSDLSECPGDKALNINERGSTFTGDLVLNGDPCDVYGQDIQNLKLLVKYQTGEYYLIRT